MNTKNMDGNTGTTTFQSNYTLKYQGSNVRKMCPPVSELVQPIQTNVQCTQTGCDLVFNNTAALRMHLVKTHKIIQNEKDKDLYYKRKNSKELVQFHCPVITCLYNIKSERHFASFKHLKQHYMRVHAEKQYMCSKCSLCYALQQDCERHERMCGVVFRCDTCACPYSTREALLTHCRRKQHQMPQISADQIKRPSKVREKKVKETVKPPPVIFIMVSNDKKTSSSDQSIPASGSVPKTADNQKSYQKTTPVPIRPKGLPSIQLPIPLISSINQKESLSAGRTVAKSLVTVERCSINRPYLNDRNRISTSALPMTTSQSNVCTLLEKSSEGCQTEVSSSQSVAIAACCQTDDYVSEQSAQTHNDMTLFDPSVNQKALSFENQSAQTQHTSVSFDSDNGELIQSGHLLPFTVSTGTQAQVAPCKKSAVETQTSGNYILEKAMENAHLPVVKRSRSSQASSAHVRKARKTNSSQTQTGRGGVTRKHSAATNTVIRNDQRKSRRVRKTSSPKTMSAKQLPRATTARLQVTTDFGNQILNDFSQNLCDFADNETQTMALLDDLEASLGESISTQTLESYLTDNPLTDSETLVQNSSVQTMETNLTAETSIQDFDMNYFHENEFHTSDKNDLDTFSVSDFIVSRSKSEEMLPSENGKTSTKTSDNIPIDISLKPFTSLCNNEKVGAVDESVSRSQSPENVWKAYNHQATTTQTQTTPTSKIQNQTQTVTLDDLPQISMHTQTLDFDRFCRTNMETQTLTADSSYTSHMHTQTLELDSFCQSNMETQTFDMELCQTHNETQTVDDMFNQLLSNMETQTVGNLDFGDFELTDIQTQTSLSQESYLSMGSQTLLNALEDNSVLSMDIETQTNLALTQAPPQGHDTQLTNIETQTLFPELDLTDTYTQTQMSFL